MRERTRLVRGLVSGMVTLWAAAAGAQEPTATALTWDQEEVSATALELDAVLATGLELAAAEPSDANAERAAAHAERLAAEVQELAARLAAGEDREATRELMNRIENRRAMLAGMDAGTPAFLSPEDAAAASALWDELRGYYRVRPVDAALEATE